MLPLELNRLLIIVVVASMALTPVLAEAGARAFEWIERQERASVPGGAPSDAPPGEAGEPSVDGAIVLAGFGPPGQAVASLLRARVERSPACFLPENASSPICAPSFVAFDLDPRRVQAAVARGFPVLYGDASRPDTLRAARLTRPAACVVAYADPQRSLAAVASMRAVFGDGVPIHARARDPSAAAALRQAGASVVVVDALETGLLLAHGLLRATGETEASALALSAAARAAVGRVPGGQATCLLLPSDSACVPQDLPACCCADARVPSVLRRAAVRSTAGLRCGGVRRRCAHESRAERDGRRGARGAARAGAAGRARRVGCERGGGRHGGCSEVEPMPP